MLEKEIAGLKERRNTLMSKIIASSDVSSQGENAAEVAKDIPQKAITLEVRTEIVFLDERIEHLSQNLSEANARLARTSMEGEYLQRQIAAEAMHKQSTNDWMQAMQGVMWPVNADDLDIGRPVDPNKLFDPQSPNQVIYSLETLGLTSDLIPSTMGAACDAARALRIDEIDDVREVFDAFRYMSWLNITLHCLRRPLPTIAIRFLIRAARIVPWVEDKHLKALNNLLNRAM